MRYLRSMTAFLVPGLAGILILLSGVLWGRHRARDLATRVIGHWGTALAGMHPVIHDPDQGAEIRPAVFVFNHQSGVDPVLLCTLLRGGVVGVAKRSLRFHPLLGPLLWLAGTVFVERGAGRGGMALAPARRVLQQGLAVAIAPEGHRPATLGRFRPGALHLAREAGVPLIPVVIHDSAAILPRGALLMRPGRVHVTVLSPQDPKAIEPQDLETLYHETLARGPAAD